MSYPGYPGYGAYPYYLYTRYCRRTRRSRGWPASVCGEFWPCRIPPPSRKPSVAGIAKRGEHEGRSEVDQLKASKASARAPSCLRRSSIRRQPHPAPPQPYSAYPNYAPPAPPPGASYPPPSHKTRFVLEAAAGAQSENRRGPKGANLALFCIPNAYGDEMLELAKPMGTRSSAALRAIATAERHEATRSSRLRRWPRPSG